MKVFVTRELPGDELDRLRIDHEVHVWPSDSQPTPEQLLEEASSADALITMLTDVVDESLFSMCPRLVAVSNYAVGFENINVDAATQHGIPVGNTPDVLTEASAQYALTLTLQLLRLVPQAASAVRRGEWRTFSPIGYIGRDFRDTTVGVIGYGRIGRSFADLATAIGMRVLHTGGDHSLNELLSASNIISMHVPLTVHTRGMIGTKELSAMQLGSYVVNTSRGGVVDTDALGTALASNHLAGAALDVTDPEPLPADHPLLRLDNVLVTPHIASATWRSRVGMAERAVTNILCALGGEPMPNCVNPEVYKLPTGPE